MCLNSISMQNFQGEDQTDTLSYKIYFFYLLPGLQMTKQEVQTQVWCHNAANGSKVQPHYR